MLAALLVASAVVLRAAILGEVVASGPDWQLVARAHPFDASISWEGPERVGGAGGLARPGRLTEAVVYRPPDGDVLYAAGVLPAGAVEVVADDGATTRQFALHELLTTDFWSVGLVDAQDEVTLVATDAAGNTVQRQTVVTPTSTQRATTTTFPENPAPHLGRLAEDRAGVGEAIMTWGTLVAMLAGLVAMGSWARRRRDRGEEAGRTNAEGAEGMIGPLGH